MKNLSKKQWAGIFTAIATIATIIASMLGGGCSAIKSRSILNDVNNAAKIVDRVGIVCNAADLLGVPDADKCVDVISKLQKTELVAVYDTAECIDSHKEKVKVSTCIDAVKGWKKVAEKLDL